MSSAAQQLLCACITADMRSPNTCCASGYHLLCDIRKTSYPPSGRLTGVWNGWWADFKSVGTARAEAPREMCHVRTNTPCFTLIEQALSVFFNVNYI